MIYDIIPIYSPYCNINIEDPFTCYLLQPIKYPLLESEYTNNKIVNKIKYLS